MKFSLLVFLFFTVSLCFSQNRHEALVVDSEGKESLEFVGVFNGKNHTMTNADGRFLFSSNLDSITFYRVGYEKLNTTFSQLRDTVYLQKSLFELDEVVVTNEKTLFQKVKDSLAKNFMLKPHKEKFLLRCVLKYNDTISRIQDIQGRLERKTQLYLNKSDISKKDYKVQIDNMRKVGLVLDSQDAYFIFPSFYKIWGQFASLNTTDDGYGADKISYFDNGKKIKLEFGSDSEKPKGYYIINSENLAIEEFYLKSEPRGDFSKSKIFRYRTILFETHILFSKDSKRGKYFISSAKGNAKVENTDKMKSFQSVYDIGFILITSENFGNFKISSNVNEQKDLFKIDYPYDQSYWQAQNQLLLTEEMEDFIKNMGEENKEFKVRGNMN